jgi:hypothetical protein
MAFTGARPGSGFVARSTLPVGALTALLLLLSTVLMSNPLFAAGSDDAAAIPEPTRLVADHRGEFNGERIGCQAITGETFA